MNGGWKERRRRRALAMVAVSVLRRCVLRPWTWGRSGWTAWSAFVSLMSVCISFTRVVQESGSGSGGTRGRRSGAGRTSRRRTEMTAHWTAAGCAAMAPTLRMLRSASAAAAAAAACRPLLLPVVEVDAHGSDPVHLLLHLDQHAGSLRLELLSWRTTRRPCGESGGTGRSTAPVQRTAADTGRWTAHSLCRRGSTCSVDRVIGCSGAAKLRKEGEESDGLAEAMKADGGLTCSSVRLARASRCLVRMAMADAGGRSIVSASALGPSKCGEGVDGGATSG